MSIFDLSTLTPEQRAITERAINAVSFDWTLLVPKLRATKGKERIPVEWADLSRYAQAAEEAEGSHAHIHEGDDVGHLLAGEVDNRKAALGLAWYSGKISIAENLVGNPDLAIEVFIAEGAHMVDFFFMTDEQRAAIFAAYHGGDTSTAHGHGWFEETGNQDYWSWVGESFMSGFLHAYADGVPTPLEARQPWVHKTTPEIAAAVRNILTPTPDPAPAQEFLTSRYGTLIHKTDCPRVRRIKHPLLVTTRPANKRPCKKCMPEVATQ